MLGRRQFVEASHGARLVMGEMEEQGAVSLAPDAGDRALLHHFRSEPGIILGISFPVGRAECPHRADQAQGAMAQADRGAQFHHGLVVVAGSGGGYELPRQRGKALAAADAVSIRRGIARQAGEDPDHVAVDAGRGLAEGDAGDGGGGVGADARQFPPGGGCAGEGAETNS